MLRTEITPAHIMPMADYGARRTELRRESIARKKYRRLPIGPHAMLYFENFATMLAQVHEMLFIERGGEDQLADELAAYNPLVPNGRELVATLMFEIEDEGRRQTILAGLGGVEHQVCLMLGDQRIAAIPEKDLDRTTAEGKASSVQFLHFPFSDSQIAAFRDPSVKVAVAIEHPAYGHAAVMPEPVRQALAEDFAPDFDCQP